MSFLPVLLQQGLFEVVETDFLARSMNPNRNRRVSLQESLFIDFQQNPCLVLEYDWRRSVDDSQFTFAKILSFENQYVECVCSIDCSFVFYDVVVSPFPKGMTINI